MVDMNGRPADLVVVGAGMAGLTAAAYATRLGLDVVVIEKAQAPGGTAALSSGYIWTAPSLEALRGEDPDCNPELGSALAEHFPEGLEWISSLQIELPEKITGIYGFGYGHQIEIGEYLERCTSIVEAAGRQILTGVDGVRLVEHDGRVDGVSMSVAGAPVSIGAEWTLLATGGLQGDRTLRRSEIGPEAEELVLRAAPDSTGDGFRLGLSVAAMPSRAPGFYGHLIAYPLDSFEPKDYLTFAQLHSGHCVLVNQAGQRFTDESLGDHINNQETLRQPRSRGLLIGDERVRREHVLSAYIPGMEILDKLEYAAAAGAHYATADTPGELAAHASAWGYDAAGTERTVAHQGFDSPPLFAIEVRPTITFAYAGLSTNADAQVLGPASPVPGLLAAGADVGGVYKRGYAGSLARSLVFGIRAALTAARRPSWH
jgi:succinate dehydrogenase/fumarate reductase flavoprotein subunit